MRRLAVLVALSASACGVTDDDAAVAVPTLGGWGVVILAMGLGFLGFQRFSIGRKQLSKQE